MILVDTGPLVALSDPRDQHHKTAVRDHRGLGGEPLVTCDAVIAEAFFHLRHPHQRLRLQAVMTQFRLTPVLSPRSGPTWPAVTEWMTRYAEHGPDWADGCIAVLSGLDPSLSVWTFDEEFRTLWRRPDGSRIPLAVRSASRR